MNDKKDIQTEANEAYQSAKSDFAEQIARLENENEEISEKAREEIQDEPLETATKSDFDGSKQYMILLGTGGPAMRIYGELDEYGQPMTAEYQYQNWFTPWTTADESADDKNLLAYAQVFYFGE